MNNENEKTEDNKIEDELTKNETAEVKPEPPQEETLPIKKPTKKKKHYEKDSLDDVDSK